MNFLSPITALVAASAAIPLLTLLYFLKLRRQKQAVSSTLLWKRAVQDLRVNAPFQRLRRNILLLLQLLAMLALLAALAQPVLSLRPHTGRRYVLLIDRSASMSAVEADGRTRLEHAKSRARRFVDTLRTDSSSVGDLSLGGSADRAMVVAFDRQATVLCSFTSDKRRLREAIDSIRPTHAPARLGDALRVARAYAQPVCEEQERDARTVGAQLELFSDGRIHDQDEHVIHSGELNYHRIGAAESNVAILAMQARREYEQPEKVRVFAALGNYADEAKTFDVQLSIDGAVRAVDTVTLPARTEPTEDEPVRPGMASVAFDITHDDGGLVEVRHLYEDALSCDDAAWSVLEPPKRLRALLVTEGNIALESALRSCPLAGLDVVAPERFDAMTAEEIESGYDLVVLDGHAPEELARSRYLVFGRPPPASGVAASGPGEDQVVVDWRSSHPVLRHIDLGDLYVRRYYRLEPPRDAEVLAEMGDSPAMVIVRRGGGDMLLVAFDVTETNWPFEPGFVMFCYNATRYMGLEIGRSRGRRLAAGDALIAAVGSPGSEVVLTTPDGGEHSVQADDTGTVRYAETNRTGVYRLRTDRGDDEYFVVNLLDAAESRIAPAENIEFSGHTVVAGEGEEFLANRDLWPLLVLATLVLVCVEWLVYSSKVRL